MGGLGFLLGGSLLGYTDVVVQWTYFGFCLKLDGSSCYFEIMRLSESMTSLVKTVSSTNPWVQLFVCLIHLIYIIYWFVNSSSQIIFNSRMYSQGCINPLGHNSLSELLVALSRDHEPFPLRNLHICPQGTSSLPSPCSILHWDFVPLI